MKRLRSSDMSQVAPEELLSVRLGYFIIDLFFSKIKYLFF